MRNFPVIIFYNCNLTVYIKMCIFHEYLIQIYIYSATTLIWQNNFNVPQASIKQRSVASDIYAYVCTSSTYTAHILVQSDQCGIFIVIISISRVKQINLRLWFNFRFYTHENCAACRLTAAASQQQWVCANCNSSN